MAEHSLDLHSNNFTWRHFFSPVLSIIWSSVKHLTMPNYLCPKIKRLLFVFLPLFACFCTKAPGSLWTWTCRAQQNNLDIRQLKYLHVEVSCYVITLTAATQILQHENLKSLLSNVQKNLRKEMIFLKTSGTLRYARIKDIFPSKNEKWQLAGCGTDISYIICTFASPSPAAGLSHKFLRVLGSWRWWQIVSLLASQVSIWWHLCRN